MKARVQSRLTMDLVDPVASAFPTAQSGRLLMGQEDHDLRIDYIEFPVLDINEAKRFYSSVFGWSCTDWGPDYASFDDGRLYGGNLCTFHVISGEPHELAVRRLDPRPGQRQP